MCLRVWESVSVFMSNYLQDGSTWRGKALYRWSMLELVDFFKVEVVNICFSLFACPQKCVRVLQNVRISSEPVAEE